MLVLAPRLARDPPHDLELIAVRIPAVERLRDAVVARPSERAGRAERPRRLGEVLDRRDLATAAQDLANAGALGGASDHGVSKSLYGQDPDGNEFEIMWRVPRDAWGEYEHQGAVLPLDLDAEVKRWGAAGTARA